MIRIFFFYLLIFFISLVFASSSRKYKYLILFMVIFQITIFLGPLTRLFNSTFASFTALKFLFFLSWLIIVNVIIKIIKKKNNNGHNYIQIIYMNIVNNISNYFMNLTYFNKHLYFLINTYIVKLECFFRPLIVNPNIFFNFFFIYPQQTIIIFLFVEIFFFNKITFSFYFFFFFLICQRLIILVFFAIKNVALTSTNYNFEKIQEKHFKLFKQNEKDFIFALLDSSNLNNFIFEDHIIERDYLRNKIIIINSVLHFAKIFLLLKIYLDFVISKYKLLLNLELFLILIFFFFKIEKLILIDILIIFLVLNSCFEIPTKSLSSIKLLIYKLTIAIPRFVEDIKTLYVSKNLLLVEDIDSRFRGCWVKHSPYKPTFLEGFNDLPVWDEKDTSKNSPINFLKTLFFFFSVVLFVSFLNRNLDICQEVLLNYISHGIKLILVCFLWIFEAIKILLYLIFK